MVFQSTITNEQTAELPSARFDGPIIIVDHEEQIEAACQDLAAHKVIGFDTETRPSFKAGVTNKVALLQLSTPERCYLIRLCRTKLHSQILKILSSPDILKIGADVAGDVRSLHVLRHFNARGFIDLQQIVSHWGIEEKSLRKMSAIVLGQRVSKAQRLSNWEASSLTPQQQVYAATDAWICINIYNKLLSVEPLTPLPKPSQSDSMGKDEHISTHAETSSQANEPKREAKARSKSGKRFHHRRYYHRPQRKTNSENSDKQ